MPPYPLNDKRRRSRWDTPAAVRVQFFKKKEKNLGGVRYTFTQNPKNVVWFFNI